MGHPALKKYGLFEGRWPLGANAPKKLPRKRKHYGDPVVSERMRRLVITRWSRNQRVALLFEFVFDFFQNNFGKPINVSLFVCEACFFFQLSERLFNGFACPVFHSLLKCCTSLW
jgi:hypothetical protein